MKFDPIVEELLFIPEDKYEEIYRQAFYDVTIGLEPVEDPIVLVIGGQPGSGKSTLFGKFKQKDFNHNIVQLDNDILRKYHPNYIELFSRYPKDVGTYTNKFAADLLDRIAGDLVKKRYNFSVESSFKDIYAVQWLAEELLEIPPYKLRIVIVATPKDIAWEGVISRYSEMEKMGLIPRAVPREFFDKSVDSIPETVSRIWRNRFKLSIDSISVVTRKMCTIFDSSWKDIGDPGVIVLNQLNKEKILGEELF